MSVTVRRAIIQRLLFHRNRKIGKFDRTLTLINNDEAFYCEVRSDFSKISLAKILPFLAKSV